MALPRGAMGLSAVCDCGISLLFLFSSLIARWSAGLQTLRRFRLVDLTIDEMVGA